MYPKILDDFRATKREKYQEALRQGTYSINQRRCMTKNDESLKENSVVKLMLMHQECSKTKSNSPSDTVEEAPPTGERVG